MGESGTNSKWFFVFFFHHDRVIVVVIGLIIVIFFDLWMLLRIYFLFYGLNFYHSKYGFISDYNAETVVKIETKLDRAFNLPTRPFTHPSVLITLTFHTRASQPSLHHTKARSLVSRISKFFVALGGREREFDSQFDILLLFRFHLYMKPYHKIENLKYTIFSSKYIF